MTPQISEVDTVVNNLSELQEDATVPRNVRIQIQNTIKNLKANTELPIKVNKALNELDEISNDVNLQSYARTQIWNVMSVLEKLH
ncbi:MAG: UPF0147 family protein [Candidatus Woesearchaeota archaeon]|mgnify:CR=1 FL=1|nr:UPF0147 family protein [Candidatus Woesearchaeota archaeon]